MTKETETTNRRPRVVEAWTAWQLAAAADSPHFDVLAAERVLDEAVFEGAAVRLTCGDQSYYVAGNMTEVLDDLGASPVTADETERMRAYMRGLADGRRLGGERP